MNVLYSSYMSIPWYHQHAFYLLITTAECIALHIRESNFVLGWRAFYYVYLGTKVT